MQQVQGQLSGTKEQLHLIQKRLSNSNSAQAQAPFASGASSNSHAQPAEPAQEYGLHQQYQDAQVYQEDQDADMEFEPPGSARGLDRDPSFDPPDMGRPSAAPSNRDEGQGAAGSQGQDQGQGDLYSPGLSAQPSGSNLVEPDLHSKLLYYVIQANLHGRTLFIKLLQACLLRLYDVWFQEIARSDIQAAEASGQMPCGAIDSAEIACYACEGHPNTTSMPTGFCCWIETYHMHTAQVAAAGVQ